MSGDSGPKHKETGQPPAGTWYAHTKQKPDGSPAPLSEWEPLFTHLGNHPEDCAGKNCVRCKQLDPRHGHLNKVAWWTAKFATSLATNSINSQRTTR